MYPVTSISRIPRYVLCDFFVSESETCTLWLLCRGIRGMYPETFMSRNPRHLPSASTFSPIFPYYYQCTHNLKENPHVGILRGFAPIVWHIWPASSHGFFSLKSFTQSPAVGYQWSGQVADAKDTEKKNQTDQTQRPGWNQNSLEHLHPLT